MLKPFILKVARSLLIILFVLAAFIVAIPFSHAANDATEKTYYYLTDHLGSVDVVLDEEGNVVERADYLPYGNDRLRIDNSPGEDDDHKFTGKEKDDETGLMFYGARYYDPATGRFVSYDPMLLDEGSKPLASNLQNPQALNPYTYALNNPVRYTDETGEYQEDVHYDLTYFLSIAAGFDAGQSKTIATFDQYTDDNPATTSGNKDSVQGVEQTISNAADGTTSNYHFATRSDALERIGIAIASGRLDQLGEALHTFQDTYSHSGLNPISHFLSGESPDLTYNDPEKALTMTKESFYMLRESNAAQNGMGGLSADQYNAATNEIWNAASPYVLQFILAKDKTNTVVSKSAVLSKQNAELSTDGEKKEKKEEKINSSH